MNNLPKKWGITYNGNAPLNILTEEQGLEPRSAEPESAVLPLDDSPLAGVYCSILTIDKQIFTLPALKKIILPQPPGQNSGSDTIAFDRPMPFA